MKPKIIEANAREEARVSYRKFQKVLDPREITSDFDGLDPNLQLIWMVISGLGLGAAEQHIEIKDLGKTTNNVLEALAVREAP